VVDYSNTTNMLERELLLCKVNLGNSSNDDETDNIFPGGSPDRMTKAFDPMAASAIRQSLTELTTLFGGKVLDLTNETITIELAAKGVRIDSFLKLGMLSCSHSSCSRSSCSRSSCSPPPAHTHHLPHKHTPLFPHGQM
jgi:acetolactate synthase small subunit